MKKNIFLYKADLFLAITFAVFVAIIKYCYPMPHITWDSDSYINTSRNILPTLRPIGYPVFLSFLYSLSKSISFVVYSQFAFYFCSILFLLKVAKNYWPLSNVQYYLLGVLLLIEPAALYHCNTILSDVLFSGFTYLYLGTLLLYIDSKKTLLLIAHIATLCICLLLRHIALFYPVFTIIIFLAYLKNIKRVLISVLAVLVAFFMIYRSTVNWNLRTYGVAVYSPFTGWNQANNVLYAVPSIHLDTSAIEDPETRKLHAFFSAFLDTTTYRPFTLGSGYIWDAPSPLNVIRSQLEDSLKKANLPSDFTYTWYLLAPRYGKYSTFIMQHYPYQYFKAFMVPNMKSLVKPYDGEMGDYYAAHNDISTASLERYGLNAGMLYCNKQLYKGGLNHISLIFYQFRLLLFVAAIFFLLIFSERFDKKVRRALTVTIAFVLFFYFFSLSTSWFLPRYLIPVLPLLSLVIVLTLLSYRGSKYSADNARV